MLLNYFSARIWETFGDSTGSAEQRNTLGRGDCQEYGSRLVRHGLGQLMIPEDGNSHNSASNLYSFRWRSL